MPTGYTSEIKEGISFEKFVMTCARAFGALVMMRDAPMDAPIPKFEPSDYHPKQLAEATERLKRLQAMTNEEVITASEAANRKALADWEKWEQDKTELRNKYNEMLAKCVKWDPPSPDHEGLKQFMIDQINESKKWDCNEWEKPTPRNPTVWHTDEVNSTIKSISYHTEEAAAEIKRTDDRNKWVSQLRKSLLLNSEQKV